MPRTSSEPRYSSTETSGLERLAFMLVWALAFAVPCEGEIPIPMFGSISRVVGIAALVAVLLVVRLRGRLRRMHWVHIPMALFLVWICLSYLWSLDRQATFVRMGTFLQLTGVVWMIWEMAPTEKRQVSLMQAFVLGAHVAALSTVFNYVIGATANMMRYGDNAANGRALSEFQYKVDRYTMGGMNEDELGLLLALSIPMAVYLLGRSEKFWSSLTWWLHLPVCILAIFLTGSRGSLVCVGLALISLLLNLSRMAKWKIALCAIAVAATIAVALALPQAMWTRFDRFVTDVDQGTMSKRTLIWQAGLEVFREYPFVGIGYDAFDAVVGQRLGVSLAAHNSYIAVLVELGVIGEAIFATMLICLTTGALSLPPAERKLWTMTLLVWMAGVLPLCFEHRKATWILFGLLAAQVAFCARRASATSSHRARGIFHDRMPARVRPEPALWRAMRLSS